MMVSDVARFCPSALSVRSALCDRARPGPRALDCRSLACPSSPNVALPLTSGHRRAARRVVRQSSGASPHDDLRFCPRSSDARRRCRAHGAGHISAAVLAVACLAIGFRAVVSNSFNVGDQSLLVKSLLRTRSLAYGDLSGVEAVSRPIGVYHRVCVRLHFKSGSHLDVITVNDSEANRTVIDHAAALINEHLLGRS
jgi:hypothetical protein